MRKPYTYTFGGQKRSVVVEIGHAIEIEAATGQGVIALLSKLREFRGTLTEAAEIVRIALAANGQHYTTAEVLNMVMDEGLINFQTIAIEILNQLFIRDAKPAKGGKSAKPADPLDATP